MIYKIVFFLLPLSLMLVAFSSAISNESQNALDKITESRTCFSEILNKNIPSGRANESFSEALQLYEAQLALESQKKTAKYQLVSEYAAKVCAVKDSALKADDELRIFNETFYESSHRINVSSMYPDYEKIIKSFKEERFEETLLLIDEGYKDLSDLEASQTALKLFYSSATLNIRNFLKENWQRIFLSLIFVLIIGVIFWKTINRLKIRKTIRSLQSKKGALQGLIKKLQYEYFETKNISETEFRVKLQIFKEMILDIDRQIPLLNEELAKLKGLSENAPRQFTGEIKKYSFLHKELKKVYGGNRKKYKRRITDKNDGYKKNKR